MQQIHIHIWIRTDMIRKIRIQRKRILSGSVTSLTQSGHSPVLVKFPDFSRYFSQKHQYLLNHQTTGIQTGLRVLLSEYCGTVDSPSRACQLNSTQVMFILWLSQLRTAVAHHRQTTISLTFPWPMSDFTRFFRCVVTLRGVARNLFRRGQNRGTGDRSPPAGSRSRAVVRVWGRSHHIYANNHCNNLLTKQPLIFFSMGISGGGARPPCPSPLPYAPGHSANSNYY